LLILSLLTSTFAVVAYVMHSPEESQEPLPLIRFKEGGFRIAHLTDFHEWMVIEKSSLNMDEQETLTPHIENYINTVIDIYQPDLVVLGGDNIFPLSMIYDYLRDIGVKTYKRMAEVFEGKNQYWTMVFGNHDSESGVADKVDFWEAVKDYPHFIGGVHNTNAFSSFAWSGTDENGYKDDRICNFSIPIYGKLGNPAFNIYLLDSGSYNQVYPFPYRYILDNQVDWYLTEATRLKEQNNGAPVPSLLFTHIPLIEHREAYIQDNIKIGRWAGISPSDTRSRIFEDAFSFGDIRGIFTGHNHQNSITTFYKRDGHKIMMAVTPQAEAEGYEDTTSVLRSRIVDIKEGGDFSTFIDTSAPEFADRIEYGEVLSYSEG